MVEEIKPYFEFYTGFSLLTFLRYSADLYKVDSKMQNETAEYIMENFCSKLSLGYQERKKMIFNLYMIVDEEEFVDTCEVYYSTKYNINEAEFDLMDLLQSGAAGDVSVY